MTKKSATKSFAFIFGLVLLIVILLATTVYCGMLTQRWAPFRGLDEARRELKKLPMVIGDWEASEEGKLAKADVTMLQIEDGYIVRRYKNTKTQTEVNLVLMIGPTGRVVVHTPEICFGGRNYEKEKTPASVSFPIVNYSGTGPTEDTFWKLNFINRSAQGGTISFYYGVSAGDYWRASENPRSALQRYRYAYKLQAEAYVDGETDNVKTFLTECLPTIHEYLRPCE